MWFWDKPNPQKAMITTRLVSRCDWCAILSEADVRGRWCADQAAILDRIQLFREYAAELNILDRPWAFASDHSRFYYFQKEDGDPHSVAYDNTTCEVILMSGLPGVGKDTWIAQHYGDYKVISLDAIRKKLGISPTDEQGRVIQHDPITRDTRTETTVTHFDVAIDESHKSKAGDKVENFKIIDWKDDNPGDGFD